MPFRFIKRQREEKKIRDDYKNAHDNKTEKEEVEKKSADAKSNE